MVSMALLILLLVILTLNFCPTGYGFEGAERVLAKEEDHELERQLKLRNKTPIKTFKTEAGIYDCIDIRKQPALDHPSLQNHDIQMRPTSLPEEMISETSSIITHSEATLTFIDCPRGTVPIRRMTKEHLIRAKSFSDSYAASSNRPMSKNYPGQHLAILRSKDYDQMKYGLRATLSVNNPGVGPNQMSTSQMWVHNGQMALQAGWIVSPKLNGDNATRLFVLSTVDGYKTSCFNSICDSFVQLATNYPVDARLEPVSVVGGQQYATKITLFRDNVTSDWWLVINDAIYIGYFPAPIFRDLMGGASYVAWGGLAKAPVGELSPQMGTGFDGLNIFSLKFVAYQSGLKIVNASFAIINPTEYVNVEKYLDVDNRCYDNVYYGYDKHEEHVFKFGGPGGHYHGKPGGYCGV